MAARAQPREVLSLLAKTFKKYRSFQGVSLLDRLVLILIGRGAQPAKADTALERIKGGFVDWNETRLARVDDLRQHIDITGAPDSEVRALRLRDLLSKVFTDRHALDAEFLRDEDREKRAAFLAGLPGLDFAQTQAFEGSLAQERGEFPLSPQVLRVAQRLGWLPKGSPPVTKCKKVLLEIAAGDATNLAYGLVRIAETVCHVRNPECGKCALRPVCPVGKRWKEPAGKSESAV